MNTFKQVAYDILKEAGKPLHSKEITKIALKRGWLKTNGRTPELTMDAQLLRDIQRHNKKSRFTKSSSSTYHINPNYKKVTRKTMQEEFVKEAIKKWLKDNGWILTKYSLNHGHGVDIQARHKKYPRYFFIEAKGIGINRSSAEVGFIYSLGQILTRINTSKSTRYYYALGLPEISADIAKRRLPWQVAKKLLLSVLSVNQIGEVTKYDWSKLKRFQGKGNQ